MTFNIFSVSLLNGVVRRTIRNVTVGFENRNAMRKPSLQPCKSGDTEMTPGVYALLAGVSNDLRVH
jgi:hypothetical protein